MERRAERRFDVRKPLEIRVLATGPSSWKPIQAQMLDASGTGMRLRVDAPIICGSPIEITSNNTILRATVRHCTEEDGAYVIGVHIFEYVTPVGDLIRDRER